MLVVGDCTHGYTGGGFLYTNKDSISLGLVATIEHLQEADTTIYQMMDDFKKHPAVAPIIRDAAMVEHNNVVGTCHGGEPVGNDYCRAALQHFAQRGLQHVFALGVEG